MSLVEATAGGRVLLADGGGGERMRQLISRHILPPLENPELARLNDAAVVDVADAQLVFTTDSYVVTPLFFPGGDIGRLAVAGTVNDLAVMGAEPLALSLGLIIEEGFPLDSLDRILGSVARCAQEAGVCVVTGDTKVIERRPGDDQPAAGEASSEPRDGLFINTAGIGRCRPGVCPDLARIRPGDAIVINGPIAEHGLAVLSRRAGLEFGTELRSDAAPLSRLLARVFDAGIDLHWARDATRGGLAGVLADIRDGCELTVVIEEERVPVSPTARHAAEMLGLDPLAVANEGKVVCVVGQADAARLVELLRGDPLGREAAVIGRISDARPALVELRTRVGGRRIVQRPHGEDLPRIC